MGLLEGADCNLYTGFLSGNHFPVGDGPFL